MRTRLCVLASVFVAAGTVIAGCGSSSSSSAQSAAPAAASTSSSSSSTSANAATGSAAASVAGSPEIKAAVAACKQSIASAPTLSSDEKVKLAALCDKAGSGDLAGLQKATAQVCQEIVKESVPQAAQAAASASCPKP